MIPPFVQWLIPPAVGAVIGYVTNDIAIKMLFRPLAEKRLFGLRVPFTPGILPRQRRKLAANIGRMVSRELLTEAIVKDRLRSEEFRALLRTSISGYTERILDAPVSRIVRSGPDAEGSDLSRMLESVTRKFIASEAFAAIVGTLVDQLFRYLDTHSAKELFETYRGGGGESCEAFVLRLIRKAFTPENERRFGDLLERAARHYLSGGKTVADVMPESHSDFSARLAEFAYPVIVGAAVEYLNASAVRAELEVRGKLFLKDAMTELNAFQRFFVSAAQYDKTLNDRMPAIVDDLIAQIEEFAEDQANRELFVSTIRRAAETFSGLTVEEASRRFGLDPLRAARAWSSRLFAGLSALVSEPSPAGQDSIGAAVSRIVSEPVAELLSSRLGLDLETARRRLADALVARIRSEGPSLVRPLAAGILAEYGDKSVSSFLSIDSGEKERMDGYLAEKTLALMDERISAVLAGLDIQKIVADRIDSLDMEDVERIVLDVLADQLKWINVFGALLGALLGVFQASLSLILS